ncbi:MAG: aldo/keto reductase [Spirulinaceae cyanobacterium SM2_1_0]|nr:aldo/keto reductase [Spirulinaceae cyanobacterium SM2_1_0]
MQYRRFGRTNRYLSVFSLGTMRCLSSAETVRQTVVRALELGINHIETARGYGQSEVYLGQALQSDLPLSRDRLFLTTKLVPTPDAATMRQAIADSLHRLQVDYLDAIALHGLNTPQHLAWVQAPDGCLPALREARAAGQVRHLGFSTHGALDLILAALEIEDFEFVNLHYYYFLQRQAAAIARAAERDLGIFIISPADKGGQLYAPSAKLAQLCQPLTPLDFNYRWLLSDQRLTTLSFGARQPEDLTAIAAIADQTGPLSADEQAIAHRLEQALTTTLDPDCCRQCYQCLPCPEAIQIPEVLRLRNLAVAYDMTAFGRYRYGMFENAGHWFPGRRGDRCTDCGDCLPRCPEQLDIPRLLRDTHQRLAGRDRRRLWED